MLPTVKSTVYVPGGLAGRVATTWVSLYAVMVAVSPLIFKASDGEAAPPNPLPLIVIESPPIERGKRK